MQLNYPPLRSPPPRSLGLTEGMVCTEREANTERSRAADSWGLYIWGMIPVSSSYCPCLGFCKWPHILPNSLSLLKQIGPGFLLIASKITCTETLPVAFMMKSRFLDTVTSRSSGSGACLPLHLLSQHIYLLLYISVILTYFFFLFSSFYSSGLERAVFSLLWHSFLLIAWPIPIWPPDISVSLSPGSPPRYTAASPFSQSTFSSWVLVLTEHIVIARWLVFHPP